MGRADKGIEVEGLIRRFKDVEAVAGIDLTISPGEIYGFLGPNGAGKSTTVHVLTTLLPPTSGRASVAGFDVVRQGPKVRASIGAALQEAALDPFLTGREHLRLGASLHGIRGDARKKLIERLLDRVGLIDHGHIVAEGTPAQLKAEIGKATVEVVPESPDELERLRQLMRRFGEETAARPGAFAVQLNGNGELPAVIRALDTENMRAAEINLHQPTLDDVFLAKTGRTLEGAEEQ